MIQFLGKKWTFIVARLVGGCLLLVYLVDEGNPSFSPLWAACYIAISLTVACVFVGLRLHDRFPQLDRYHFSRVQPLAGQISENEWIRRKVRHVSSMVRGNAVLITPAEDGLICVPILIIGISPISAIIGGAVFGALHLATYTYLECIGKAIIYALACVIILPHGVLNIVLGHFVLDVSAAGLLMIFRRRLPSKP